MESLRLALGLMSFSREHCFGRSLVVGWLPPCTTLTLKSGVDEALVPCVRCGHILGAGVMELNIESKLVETIESVWRPGFVCLFVCQQNSS